MILAASGCSGIPTEPSSLIEPTQTSEANIPPSPSPEPTPTPAINRILLVSGQVNGDFLQKLQSTISAQANQAQMVFETVESVQPNEIQPQDKVVIFLSPPGDLINWTSTSPQTQFVAISNQEMQTAENLSLIRSDPAQQSFLLGFIAALVAPDFRVGGLFDANDPLASQLQDSFSNGARYYCGRCVPVYAPVVFFPVAGNVSNPTDNTAWQTAFAEMDTANRLEVIALPAAALQPDLLGTIQNEDILMVGTQIPADEYRSKWVATVRQDTIQAIEEILPGLLKGEGGKNLSASLVIEDVNEAWLTPGKKALAEKLIEDLRGGWINPLSVP